MEQFFLALFIIFKKYYFKSIDGDLVMLFSNHFIFFEIIF